MSYADAVQPPINNSVVFHNSKRAHEEVLILKPETPKSNAKTSHSEIENLIEKASALDLGGKPPKFRAIKGNGVAAVFPNREEFLSNRGNVEKLCTEMKMSISEPKERKPRLIVRKIPISWANEKIENEIAEQVQGCKTIKILRSQREGITFCACVIEVSTEQRTCLLDQGFINFKWRRCPVSDHFHIVQCFTCCGFGHKSDVCQRSPICCYCAKNHLSKDCPDSVNDLPVCINCSKRGLRNDHCASDHYSCETVRQIQGRMLARQSKN